MLKSLRSLRSLYTLDIGWVEKAKTALKEGTSLVSHHIKLIRLVDKSEFGWEMGNQYKAEELATNAEDDKCIYHSERREEKKLEEKILLCLCRTLLLTVTHSRSKLFLLQLL